MQPCTHPLGSVHDRAYVEAIAALSDDHTKGIHRVGDESGFAPGGFEIAALAAGGAIVATDEVLKGAAPAGRAKIDRRAARTPPSSQQPQPRRRAGLAAGERALYSEHWNTTPKRKTLLTPPTLVGSVANAYALCRPPGHHAERSTGLG